MYLLQPEASVAASVVRDGLLQETVSGLRSEGAGRISVNLFDEAVEQGAGSVIAHRDPPIRAMVCFWLENSGDRAGCEALLGAQVAQLAGYLVVESRPLVHSRAAGGRVPGYNLVTRIFQRPDISYETFIQRWMHDHREVALATSARSYVRNAVVRTLTVDAPVCQGIVEQNFPIEALTDPHLWYDCDSEEEYQRRLTRMMDDVASFLDMEPLETLPMSEYWMG